MMNEGVPKPQTTDRSYPREDGEGDAGGELAPESGA